MRFATSEGHAELYDTLVGTLEAIGDSPANASIDAALAGAWRIVSELGFGPALDSCASCHAPIADDASAAFSHPAGGVLCRRCTSLAGSSRLLPWTHARPCARGWPALERRSPTTRRDARTSGSCESFCYSISPTGVRSGPTMSGSETAGVGPSRREHDRRHRGAH